LLFDQADNDDQEVEEEEFSPGARGATTGTAWDTIPETLVMSEEVFSTTEEECVPADLVRTIHSLQTGLSKNANNLTLMHHELSAHWLLILVDLKNLQGNQVILQSQINTQAAGSLDEGPDAAAVEDLNQNLSRVLSELPEAQERVKVLEDSKALLEDKNKVLEAKLKSL
jgi:hypothetical protein